MTIQLINSTVRQDVTSVTSAIETNIKNGKGGAKDFKGKQGFSVELTTALSEAYGVKMEATNMSKRYRGNVSTYKGFIDKLDAIDTPTVEEYNELLKWRVELGQCMSKWSVWYNAIKAGYKMRSLVPNKALYDNYVTKREDREGYFKNLKAYFEANYNVKLSDKTVDYINDTIGRKRAAMTVADKRQTQEFNITEYFLFLTDTMIELAIAKKQMKIGVACKVVEDVLDHIEEFDHIITLPKRQTLTVEQMKKYLNEVGVSVPSKAKKIDVQDIWDKAKKDGIFAEYMPYLG